MKHILVLLVTVMLLGCGPKQQVATEQPVDASAGTDTLVTQAMLDEASGVTEAQEKSEAIKAIEKYNATSEKGTQYVDEGEATPQDIVEANGGEADVVVPADATSCRGAAKTIIGANKSIVTPGTYDVLRKPDNQLMGVLSSVVRFEGNYVQLYTENMVNNNLTVSHYMRYTPNTREFGKPLKVGSLVYFIAKYSQNVEFSGATGKGGDLICIEIAD